MEGKQTLQPLFGIITTARSLLHFCVRSLPRAATGWTLMALAYNCGRIARP
jgi:hypothetical protein